MTSEPGPYDSTSNKDDPLHPESPESSVHPHDFRFEQNDNDHQYNKYSGNYDINDNNNYNNNPWEYSPSSNKDSEDDHEPSHPENASNIC